METRNREMSERLVSKAMFGWRKRARLKMQPTAELSRRAVDSGRKEKSRKRRGTGHGKSEEAKKLLFP